MNCDGSGMKAWTGRTHLAVPIDGENASARHARAVFEAASKLREGGFPVYGFGEHKTPRALRSACHRFVTIGKARNSAIGQTENWY